MRASGGSCAALVVAVTIAAVTGLGAPAAGVGAATAPGGTWGNAQEVPGMAALNAGNAEINSVSCASPGNCSVGGDYQDSTGAHQAFVVDETGGTWGTAQEVPGTAALNVHGLAGINSVSCASTGNCSAGGYYQGSINHQQAFVVAETGGTWGTAQKVPGTTALNAGGAAEIDSLSCASVGDCSAGGSYTDSSGGQQALVVTETNGIWGKAKEVPGTAVLNTRGNGSTFSVSCGSGGNCSAGGLYTGSSGNEGFVVAESNGIWGKAREVPGTASLNHGYAFVRSVSCRSVGNCSAGGGYENSSGSEQAFVVNETNGIWGKAKEVPGTASLNAGTAETDSVSCTSAGNCSAGGTYEDSSNHQQAFVVNETNGTWGKAKEVPGTAALNVGGSAAIESVSCTSAGNCSAGGAYEDSSVLGRAFVVDESGGIWGKAREIPGTATLGTGGAEVSSVSCASTGNCSAGGYYRDGSGHQQVFVADETNP